MEKWIVLCAQSMVALEKKRFGREAKVIGFREAKRNAILKELQTASHIISMEITDDCLLDDGISASISIILSSHPVSYQEAIDKLQKRVHFYFTDRTFVHDAKELLNLEAGFIPPDDGVIMNKKNWANRSIDVLYVGAYLFPKDKENTFKYFVPSAMEPMARNVVKDFENSAGKSINEVWKHYLDGGNYNYDKDTQVDLQKYFAGEFCEYIMRDYRDGIVRALLERGIKVTVSGANWFLFKEELPEGQKELLNIVGVLSHAGVALPLMSDAKVVIGVEYEFRDGLPRLGQDALNSGCMLLSEKNPCTEGLAESGANLLTYDIHRYKALMKKIQKILGADGDPRTLKKTNWVEAVKQLMKD